MILSQRLSRIHDNYKLELTFPGTLNRINPKICDLPLCFDCFKEGKVDLTSKYTQHIQIFTYNQINEDLRLEQEGLQTTVVSLVVETASDCETALFRDKW